MTKRIATRAISVLRVILVYTQTTYRWGAVSRPVSGDGGMMISTNLIRLAEVSRSVGLPRSTIYALIAKGQFPRPIKLSERSSAGRTDELEAWVEARTKASRPEPAR
jgi:prophage regulatory protein